MRADNVMAEGENIESLERFRVEATGILEDARLPVHMLIRTISMTFSITLCWGVEVHNMAGNTVSAHPKSRNIPMRLLWQSSWKKT